MKEPIYRMTGFPIIELEPVQSDMQALEAL